MLTRMLRLPLAAAVFVILLVAAGQMALADTVLSQSGNVGANSLTDTHAKPGATCNYKFNSGLGLGKLKTITVRAPNMAASPGRSHQIIGWKFSIERRRVGEQSTAWKTIYHSVLQTTAIGGEGGGFESMTAPITLDPNEGATGVHRYRVDVQMEWFAKNGQTVVGKSLHRVDFYRGVMNTGQHWVDDGWCAGLSPS